MTMPDGKACVLSSANARGGVGQVSRARVTQIMNLLHLVPDIQEAILFLPRVARGGNPIYLEHLQASTALLDWQASAVAGMKYCRQHCSDKQDPIFTVRGSHLSNPP
jgi:hypothetical protein